MISMNQNFIHFFTKANIHIKEYKRKSQRFIKFYTSRLVKSSICNQEYFNANLYTNLLSDKDTLIQKRIEDLTSLECQCNGWHFEDSITSFSPSNAIGITYWSVLLLGKYLSKKFPNEKFYIFGDIQCHNTKRSKKLLPIATIKFHKIREDEENWLLDDLDMYSQNAIFSYRIDNTHSIKQFSTKTII